MGNSFINTEYGSMSENLSSSRLEELCIADNGVQTGPFGSLLHKKDYVNVGTPIITVEHLGENRIIHDNLPRVSNKDKQRLEKFILHPGDIVFSRVGSVDRRALVRETEDGWLFSGRCLRVRPNQEKINSEYLSYFFGLPAFKNYINRIAVGATMPSLNTKLLSDVPIYFPKLPVQKSIGHILGTFDDKIELNKQMNNTLEEIARAIFKSWFLDFDPVYAKQAGEEPVGMDTETAAIFPDSFVESELGLIPEGWCVGELAEVAEVVDCLHAKKPEPQERGPLLLQVFNIGQSGQLDFSKTYPITYEDYKYWTRRFEASPGDLIISKTGRVGAIAQIPKGLKAGLGRNLVGIRAKLEFLSPAFLKDSMLSHTMRKEIGLNTSQGTILSSLHVKHISRLRLVLPPKHLIKTYERTIGPLHRKIESNGKESSALTKLRDTLLPKLISREVMVEGFGE